MYSNIYRNTNNNKFAKNKNTFSIIFIPFPLVKLENVCERAFSFSVKTLRKPKVQPRVQTHEKWEGFCVNYDNSSTNIFIKNRSCQNKGLKYLF